METSENSKHRATHHLEIWRDRYIWKIKASISLPEAEATRGGGYLEHFNGNFEELMEDECGHLEI